jgi:capsule polysaccharide modification protein KpsS
LKEAIIQKLLVFEKKILRRIFGPTKENQIWRVKTNEEFDKLTKHKNIINHIKAQRLSWFGHIQRMPDTRTVKKMFNWKPKDHMIDPSTDGRITSQSTSAK